MAADGDKYWRFGVVAVVGAALDQATKIWAREHLVSYGRRGLSVLGRKLVFVHAENPGIAFSQLQAVPGGRIVLSLVALLALGFVVQYLRKTPSSQPWVVTALGLVAGGALGNVIDRLRLGAVTDFVVVNLGVWPLNPWPVFNVADALLVAGACLLALGLVRARRVAGAPVAAARP